VVGTAVGVGAIVGAATYGPTAFAPGAGIGAGVLIVTLAWAWTGRLIVQILGALAVVTALAIAGAWAEILAGGASPAGGAGAGMVAAALTGAAVWSIARRSRFRIWLAICIGGLVIGVTLLALFPTWGLNSVRLGIIVAALIVSTTKYVTAKVAYKHKTQRYTQSRKPQ